MISYSYSTITRCRCKYCGSAPSKAYYKVGKLSFADPIDIIKLKDYIWKRRGIVNNFYSMDSPKNFTNINCFSSKADFNKISIKYRQYHQITDKLDMSNMILLCDCFKTAWTISVSDRDHIKNRKSQKVYPFKIKTY